MKTTIITLLIATTLSITAFARIPYVHVEMSLRSAADDNWLTGATVFTASGKQATTKSGKFEYRVTPILHDDGTVDISSILTERVGKNTHIVVDQRTKAEVNHVAEVRFGDLVFRTTTSLVK